MNHNFKNIMKRTPTWKIILYLILAAMLSTLTTYILTGFMQFFHYSSVTSMTLQSSLLDILGRIKYYYFLKFIVMLPKLIGILFFIVYSYLFYRRERQLQFTKSLRGILDDVHKIANGQLQGEIRLTHHSTLNILRTDIYTIVKQLEDAMSEERRLEQTKTELITNVSHDLRTPLTSIIGYLSLVEQDAYKDEVELRHYTNIAYEKACSLEHLVQELFEYTRMQDRHVHLQKDLLQPAEILGQLIVQNDLVFKEHQVECREKFPDTPLFVYGDGKRLARVFNNLLMNACYYGKTGKYIDVSVTTSTDSIITTISNYGEPIPHYELPYIFDRFYRVEKSRSRHTGGTGLGLAIAKSIVELHNGTIKAESNLDRTSFIVKLPKTKIENA